MSFSSKNSLWGKPQQTNTTNKTNTFSLTGVGNKNNAAGAQTQNAKTNAFSFGTLANPAQTATQSDGYVLTKVCSEGITAFTEVELETSKTETQVAPFKVNHICQNEIFQNYPVEELRFFDYVRNGFIIKPKPPTSFGQTPTTGFGFGQAGTKPATGMTQAQPQKTEQVEPWRKTLKKLNLPQEKAQDQPYGTLPSTKSNSIQTEVDQNYTAEKEIPADPGLRDRQSLFTNVTTTNPTKSATPGLRSSLKVQKLNDINTSSSLKLIQRYTARSSTKSNQVSDTQGAPDTTVMSDYIYIPDLETIGAKDNVNNFKVINQNFGSISFLEPIKVGALNPKKNIRITNRKIDIKLTVDEKRELGLKHEFPSVVALKNIYPSEGRTDETFRQYETDLEKYCSEHNLNFLSYQPEDGTLMFSVDSISAFPIEIQ